MKSKCCNSQIRWSYDKDVKLICVVCGEECEIDGKEEKAKERQKEQTRHK